MVDKKDWIYQAVTDLYYYCAFIQNVGLVKTKKGGQRFEFREFSVSGRLSECKIGSESLPLVGDH